MLLSRIKTSCSLQSWWKRLMPNTDKLSRRKRSWKLPRKLSRKSRARKRILKSNTTIITTTTTTTTTTFSKIGMIIVKALLLPSVKQVQLLFLKKGADILHESLDTITPTESDDCLEDTQVEVSYEEEKKLINDQKPLLLFTCDKCLSFSQIYLPTRVIHLPSF